jgi:voltage-gated potassium channel
VGGRVGGAAVRALHKRGVPVHLVEKEHGRCEVLRPYCDAVFPGDAAEHALLQEAGIEDAPSVLLTTHDDAINIHLASYCRRLNPKMRVVSRITHERNLEAIHRAGADFVLNYATKETAATLTVTEGDPGSPNTEAARRRFTAIAEKLEEEARRLRAAASE